MSNSKWIRELIENEIDKIVDNYEKCNFPFRTTMIKKDFCYCCNKIKGNINYLAEDSFRGRFKLVGWLYCNDCKLIVELAEKYNYKDKVHPRYSQIKFLQNENFKFYRYSKVKAYKPYVQSCIFDGSYNNLIYILDNRVFADVVWSSKLDGNIYTKKIYLSNLILNNPFYFGLSINSTKFKYLDSRWYKLIMNEYYIIDKYYLIKEICKKKGIIIDIENIIISFFEDVL